MQIFNELAPSSVIPLARYAQLIGYTECAFFGVSHPDNPNYACRELWSKTQRDDVQLYLAEAQDELEEVIGYPLQPKWFADERHSISKTRGFLTKYGKLIALGIKAESVISDNAVIDLVTDPDISTITIAGFTGTYPLTEIHVFYPGTSEEITPSNIEIVAGSLVISFPRCRAVSYSKLDTPPEGLIYSDNSNFQTLADVHRIYNDTSSQGKLYYKENPCSDFCTEIPIDVCGLIRNPEIGSVQLDIPTACCTRTYTHYSVSYEAGLTQLTHQAEMILIRLAHSKMPNEPCGCDVIHRMWSRDSKTPDLLTKERLNCPFGLSDGAWIAWKWACGISLVRAGALI